MGCSNLQAIHVQHFSGANGSRHPQQSFFFLRAFLKDEPEGLVRKTQKIKRWASPKDPDSVK